MSQKVKRKQGKELQPSSASHSQDSYQSAVCAGCEMWRGQHYAQFKVLNLAWAAMIGVVGPDFDPMEGSAFSRDDAWMLGTLCMTLWHGNVESALGPRGLQCPHVGSVIVRPCPLQLTICGLI